jgi:isopentenyldiphosphate isomerase
MTEYIDIFTDKYVHIGTMEKKEAHVKGQWHRVFTCLLVNPQKGTVLLQKKQPGRYVFDRPDYLDITVGGHYQAGEMIEDGVRELHEEVGIPAKFEDLIPVGIRQTAATIKEDYIANEFQHLFLLPIEMELEEFQLEDSEVTGLVEIDIQDGIDVLMKKTDAIKARGIFMVDGNRVVSDLELTRDDFVPAYLEIDQFFLRYFIAAKRLVKGENPEEIFV